MAIAANMAFSDTGECCGIAPTPHNCQLLPRPPADLVRASFSSSSLFSASFSSSSASSASLITNQRLRQRTCRHCGGRVKRHAAAGFARAALPPILSAGGRIVRSPRWVSCSGGLLAVDSTAMALSNAAVKGLRLLDMGRSVSYPDRLADGHTNMEGERHNYMEGEEHTYRKGEGHTYKEGEGHTWEGERHEYREGEEHNYKEDDGHAAEG